MPALQTRIGLSIRYVTIRSGGISNHDPPHTPNLSGNGTPAAATLAENTRVKDALFPKASEEERKIGWQHSYRFMEKMSDRIRELDADDDASMEVVQLVLIALEESLRLPTEQQEREPE